MRLPWSRKPPAHPVWDRELIDIQHAVRNELSGLDRELAQAMQGLRRYVVCINEIRQRLRNIEQRLSKE